MDDETSFAKHSAAEKEAERDYLAERSQAHATLAARAESVEQRTLHQSFAALYASRARAIPIDSD